MLAFFRTAGRARCIRIESIEARPEKTMNDKSSDLTIVGYSMQAGARIFIRDKRDERIFVELGGEHEFTRDNFLSFAGTIAEAAKKLEGPEKQVKAGTLAGNGVSRDRSVFLVSSGDVKLNYGPISKVFSLKAFLSFSKAAEMASRNILTFRRKLENSERALAPWKEKPEAGYGIKELSYRAGFILVMVLGFADSVLIFAGIFDTKLFIAAGIITPMIVLFYLLLPRGDAENLRTNTKKFLDDEFLSQVSRMNVSKKTVEFFVVLFLVMFFMTIYFSKAFPFVYNFWKNTFGIK